MEYLLVFYNDNFIGYEHKTLQIDSQKRYLKINNKMTTFNDNTFIPVDITKMAEFSYLNPTSLTDILLVTREFRSERAFKKRLKEDNLLPESPHDLKLGILKLTDIDEEQEKTYDEVNPVFNTTKARILEYGIPYLDDSMFFNITVIKAYLKSYIFRFSFYRAFFNRFSSKYKRYNDVSSELMTLKMVHDNLRMRPTHIENIYPCIEKFVNAYCLDNKTNQVKMENLRDIAMFIVKYEDEFAKSTRSEEETNLEADLNTSEYNLEHNISDEDKYQYQEIVNGLRRKLRDCRWQRIMQKN